MYMFRPDETVVKSAEQLRRKACRDWPSLSSTVTFPQGTEIFHDIRDAMCCNEVATFLVVESLNLLSVGVLKVCFHVCFLQ